MVGRWDEGGDQQQPCNALHCTPSYLFHLHLHLICHSKPQPLMHSALPATAASTHIVRHTFCCLLLPLALSTLHHRGSGIIESVRLTMLTMLHRLFLCTGACHACAFLWTGA
jgi:hypothetical protein